MRAVDTNVLVRLIARDNADQADAAEAFIAEGAWVSVLALAETIWVLGKTYDRNRSQLANIVETLLGHEDLTIENAEAVSLALNLFRSKPTLGFSDCLMLELARKAGHLPLGTFDRGLAKISGAQKLA